MKSKYAPINDLNISDLTNELKRLVWVCKVTEFVEIVHQKMLTADFHKSRNFDNYRNINQDCYEIESLVNLTPDDPSRLLSWVGDNNPFAYAFLSRLSNTLVHKAIVQGDIYAEAFVIINFLVELANAFESPEFRKQLDSMRKLHSNNSASLLNYLTAKKEKYRRLMIVRLDLYYRNEDGPSLKMNNADAHWNKVLKFLRINFKDSFVGYATKFEFGGKRGVHLHTILLFDGKHALRDVLIGKVIGDYWRSIVTEGNGSYFNANCRNHVSQMQYVGVGVFRELNESLQRALQRMSHYVTKPDPVVRLAVPNLRQTFRRGEMPVLRNQLEKPDLLVV